MDCLAPERVLQEEVEELVLLPFYVGELAGQVLDLRAHFHLPRPEPAAVRLEFNNMFTSFKGEGTGAVRHMFYHHILTPHPEVTGG